MAATPKPQAFDDSHERALPSRAVLFGNRYVNVRTLMTLGVETAWLGASCIALVFLNQAWSQRPEPMGVVLEHAGSLVMVYLAVFFLMDLYDLDMVTPRRALVLNLIEALGLICIVVGALKAGFWIIRIRPWFILMHLAVTAVVVVSGRDLIDRYVRARRSLVSIGFVGGPDAIAEAEKERNDLAAIGFGMEFVADSVEAAREWFERKGRWSNVRRVVIDGAILRRRGTNGFVQACHRAGIDVEEFDPFQERAFGKVRPRAELIHELAFSESRLSKVEYRMRRLRDIVLAVAGLLVTAPLSLLLAVAIKCDSAGPILFRQDRIGKDGQPFKMLKFRSMRADSGAVDGPQWTTARRDPRITRVGAVMRTLHLDELPQLINVIKGEMSLVGPRPFHPLHYAQLEAEPAFTLRQLVLPGITGWAQVRCDYSASLDDHEEVLARDLYYVKHASLLFDLLIMIDTLRICVWQRGSR